MKILVIEDEDELRKVIAESLKGQFVVEEATDYESGMDKLSNYTYDCILLDIMLPGGSGIDLLEEMKAAGNASNVIIISAKDSVDDKIKGLHLGADDYLVKPFHLAELNARIHSVLRRKSQDGSQKLVFGNVSADTNERCVSVNDVPLALNRKEFDTLVYFMMNKNRLVNKSALAEHIWGDHMDQADDYEFIYSQIKNLRKKLRDHHAGIEIQSVYGIGYKLVES